MVTVSSREVRYPGAGEVMGHTFGTEMLSPGTSSQNGEFGVLTKALNQEEEIIYIHVLTVDMPLPLCMCMGLLGTEENGIKNKTVILDLGSTISTIRQVANIYRPGQHEGDS